MFLRISKTQSPKLRYRKYFLSKKLKLSKKCSRPSWRNPRSESLFLHVYGTVIRRFAGIGLDDDDVVAVHLVSSRDDVTRKSRQNLEIKKVGFKSSYG